MCSSDLIRGSSQAGSIKRKLALFLLVSSLPEPEVNKLVREAMDSPAEKDSHQRTVTALRAVFSEPLKRLGAITQEAWDSAD